MENIKFKELIYASSEKGIITGSSGFQIRTHTQGMASDIIESVERGGITECPVPSPYRVNLEQLQADANIVKTLPVTYILKKLETTQGAKYVFARSVYIGVDYGYFLPEGGPMRAGTNYVSHALVFDKMPHCQLFSIIGRNNCFENNVFLPLDYTCSPQNAELNKLLCGNPTHLNANSFNFSIVPIQEVKLPKMSGKIINAILSLHMRKVENSPKANLILKAEHEDCNIIASFIKQFMPHSIVDSLTFTTNHQAAGMVQDIDIIMINKFYEGNLNEEDYVYIDLLGNVEHNVMQNVLSTNITKLCNANDIVNLKALLDYIALVGINQQTDLDFLYEMFKFCKSSLPIQISDISDEFLTKLGRLNANSDSGKEMWFKINSLLNDLFMSSDLAILTKALKLTDTIKEINGESAVRLSESAKRTFTENVISSANVFSELLSKTNSNNLFALLDRSMIKNLSLDQTLKLLITSSSMEVWNTLIQINLDSTKAKEDVSTQLISGVLSSSLNKDQKVDLLKTLYPYNPSGAQILYNYAYGHPEMISSILPIVSHICISTKKDCITPLIMVSGADVRIKLAPLVKQIFEKRLSQSADITGCIDELLQMSEKITPAVFAEMKLVTIIDPLAEQMYSKPSAKYLPKIKELLQLLPPKSNATKEKLENLEMVLDNKIPEKMNRQLMQQIMNQGNKDIFPEAFDKWLENGILKNELKDFIVDNDKLRKHNQLVAHMVDSLWAMKNKQYKSLKKDLIIIILDNANWDKDNYKKYVAKQEKKNPDLEEFLIKSTSFFKKMLRKLFNL